MNPTKYRNLQCSCSGFLQWLPCGAKFFLVPAAAHAADEATADTADAVATEEPPRPPPM